MTANVTALHGRAMEERYRVLVDAITDYAIYMLDTGGHVSSWNTGANRFKGYVESEILGEHFSRFYTPEDREKGVPAKALATAESEGRFEAEGWRVRKDGERFWAHVIIDAIRDPDGQLVGFAKITRDLTERKAAEEVLRRSEEQFRRLVQGVTDYAIYMLDPEGRVASWNSQASDPVPGGTPVASTGPVGLPLPAEGDGRNDVGESVYGPLVVGCRRSGMTVEAPRFFSRTISRL
jgi:PAS domain S-box-containing protein